MREREIHILIIVPFKDICRMLSDVNSAGGSLKDAKT
jgi:hypothetical protein